MFEYFEPLEAFYTKLLSKGSCKVVVNLAGQVSVKCVFTRSNLVLKFKITFEAQVLASSSRTSCHKFLGFFVLRNLFFWFFFFFINKIYHQLEALSFEMNKKEIPALYIFLFASREICKVTEAENWFCPRNFFLFVTWLKSLIFQRHLVPSFFQMILKIWLLLW